MCAFPTPPGHCPLCLVTVPPVHAPHPRLPFAQLLPYSHCIELGLGLSEWCRAWSGLPECAGAVVVWALGKRDWSPYVCRFRHFTAGASRSPQPPTRPMPRTRLHTSFSENTVVVDPPCPPPPPHLLPVVRAAPCPLSSASCLVWCCWWACSSCDAHASPQGGTPPPSACTTTPRASSWVRGARGWGGQAAPRFPVGFVCQAPPSQRREWSLARRLCTPRVDSRA